MCDLNFYGEALLSASEDCTVKVWDLKKVRYENAGPYLTMRGHTGPVLTVTSGEFVYSAGVDGDIRMWDVPPV